MIDWIGGRISGSLGRNYEDQATSAAKGALAAGGWMPNRMHGFKGRKPTSGENGVDASNKEGQG